MTWRRDGILGVRDDNSTKPLDFPIVDGRGLRPGVDLSSNAALLAFLDEIDGVDGQFGSESSVTSHDDPDDSPDVN